MFFRLILYSFRCFIGFKGIFCPVFFFFKDRTVKVWRSEDGVLCRTLQGHAHWVNTLALSTDYVLRTGAYEPAEFGRSQKALTADEAQVKAQERYDQVCQLGRERLVSGSDDFTLFLWNPETDRKFVGKISFST